MGIQDGSWNCHEARENEIFRGGELHDVLALIDVIHRVDEGVEVLPRFGGGLDVELWSWRLGS